MSASCINEYNECNKGYLIPHEGTTSRLIVIPTYICLVISYDTDLVFCLCIYTFNKFNQSINQIHNASKEVYMVSNLPEGYPLYLCTF